MKHPDGPEWELHKGGKNDWRLKHGERRCKGCNTFFRPVKTLDPNNLLYCKDCDPELLSSSETAIGLWD